MTEDVTPQVICTFCENPMEGGEIDSERMHEYSEEPCKRCKDHLDTGGFIFVSISDKSKPPHKIKRTHMTWYVEEDEVKKRIPEEHEILARSKGKQRIIFIRTTEAIGVGLLNQKQAKKIDSEYERNLSNETGEL